MDPPGHPSHRGRASAAGTNFVLDSPGLSEGPRQREDSHGRLSWKNEEPVQLGILGLPQMHRSSPLLFFMCTGCPAWTREQLQVVTSHLATGHSPYHILVNPQFFVTLLKWLDGYSQTKPGTVKSVLTPKRPFPRIASRSRACMTASGPSSSPIGSKFQNLNDLVEWGWAAGPGGRGSKIKRYFPRGFWPCFGPCFWRWFWCVWCFSRFWDVPFCLESMGRY